MATSPVVPEELNSQVISINICIPIQLMHLVALFRWMRMGRFIVCDESAHLNSVVPGSLWLPWQTGITVGSAVTPWCSANLKTSEIVLCTTVDCNKVINSLY
jgi:hypothetical protein